MNLLIGVLIGILVGLSLSLIVQMIRFPFVGTMRIDNSIPDEQPYIFLELLEAPEYVSKKKYVLVKVKRENYISHD